MSTTPIQAIKFELPQQFIPPSRFIYVNSDGPDSIVIDIAFVARHLLEVQYNAKHTCEKHRTPIPSAFVACQHGQNWTFEGAREVTMILEELVKERPELSESVGWIIQEAKLELEK